MPQNAQILLKQIATAITTTTTTTTAIITTTITRITMESGAGVRYDTPEDGLILKLILGSSVTVKL